MANITTVTSGVYQQMIVPDPYHYHQSQCQLVPTFTNHITSDAKKETKKRKKVVDKAGNDKKKNCSTSSRQQNHVSKTEDATVVSANDRKLNRSELGLCPVCNKRKCYKHIDAKCRNHLTKKTPDDVIILLKKHMLKLLSNQENAYCKIDPKCNKVDVDISKMHQSYLDEYEPNSIEATPSTDSKESKPKIKKWLYRKIFLDEFKTFDYNTCKAHLGELRSSVDSFVEQKKKKVPSKHKNVSQSTNQNQSTPQDYSLSNINGTTVDMTRHGLPHGVIGPTGHNHTSPPYQPNLMGIGGVDSNNLVPASTVPGAGLHNSLATYVTQQVPTNLLFGLGQQQQTSPTQQQPLNLQTSHPSSMHPPHPPPPGGHQPPPPGMPSSVSHSASAPPPHLPLNLHNPYYVSFSPMLPLHMPPQHNHQQQFQPNLMQPQPQHNFNQHAMYQ